MVQIYMALEGTPSARQVIVDLVESVYGPLVGVGTDESGAPLWLVETQTAFKPAPVTGAPPGSGSVHAELDGPGKDPERIHELVHGRMVCGQAEQLATGVLVFIAEPEHVWRDAA